MSMSFCPLAASAVRDSCLPSTSPRACFRRHKPGFDSIKSVALSNPVEFLQVRDGCACHAVILGLWRFATNRRIQYSAYLMVLSLPWSESTSVMEVRTLRAITAHYVSTVVALTHNYQTSSPLSCSSKLPCRTSLALELFLQSNTY